MQNLQKNLLEAALNYIALGCSVIPIGKAKKPLILWKEFQSRKPTEDEIRQWCEHPDITGIAIVTGAISGIVVVDVEKGGNIDDLPKTVMSHTGGGGWHFYYRYDPKRPISTRGRVRYLTDIRGDGGYAIAPPSLHKSDTNYAWLTPMDRNALAEFPYWLLTPTVCSQSTQRSQAIDSKIPEGKRNVTATKKAGKIFYRLDPQHWETIGWPEFQAWNAKSCLPPLKIGELRKVWESIKKREQQNGHSRKKIVKNAQPVTEIYCLRPRDGRIIEAYYDSNLEETGLLVFENGKAIKTSQVIINDKIYVAPHPFNNLIQSRFVKLPSDALSFDSEISLLEEIKAFIHDYVQIPSSFEDIATFYVFFSWVYDHFEELPYLRVIGDYGSGKSRFLKVMGALCYRSIFLNGAASASAIFRIINQVQGTIILDEADFRFSDTSNELVKILNSGFQKGIPVFRSEASGKNMKSFDPTPFNVFGPKVIATRKDFMDDALESRCLSHPMETLTREDIPENLEDNFDEKALQIRNKLVMFRFLKLSGGISKASLPKLNIEPRLRQIIAPLYRVINAPAGKNIILHFIHEKQQEVFERRYGSFEGEVLQTLIQLLETNTEPTMKDIAVAYNNTFGCKYEIKPKKIGSILEKIFHLEKKKAAHGIYLCCTPENEERIKKLKIKFGILESEMNIVNDVNIPSSMPITATDVIKVFNGGEILPD